MNQARVRLLSSILGVLGVSAGSCSKPIVAPDSPTDDPKACPESVGTFADWPGGERPAGSREVCLPKPADGECGSTPNACVLKGYVCGLHEGGDEVVGALPAKREDLCLPSLAAFAARAASEGCIAETVASLQLHAAAAAAVDSDLAEELRLTAEEESTHALLAYRIVAWAIAKGGDEVREAVQRVFESAADHIGFGPCPDDAIDLREHGVLSRRERHDLAVEVLREVIVPAGRAFIGGGEFHGSRGARCLPAV